MTPKVYLLFSECGGREGSHRQHCLRYRSNRGVGSGDGHHFPRK